MDVPDNTFSKMNIEEEEELTSIATFSIDLIRDPDLKIYILFLY